MIRRVLSPTILLALSLLSLALHPNAPRVHLAVFAVAILLIAGLRRRLRRSNVSFGASPQLALRMVEVLYEVSTGAGVGIGLLAAIVVLFNAPEPIDWALRRLYGYVRADTLMVRVCIAVIIGMATFTIRVLARPAARAVRMWRQVMFVISTMLSFSLAPGPPDTGLSVVDVPYQPMDESHGAPECDLECQSQRTFKSSVRTVLYRAAERRLREMSAAERREFSRTFRIDVHRAEDRFARQIMDGFKPVVAEYSFGGQGRESWSPLVILKDEELRLERDANAHRELALALVESVVEVEAPTEALGANLCAALLDGAIQKSVELWERQWTRATKRAAVAVMLVWELDMSDDFRSEDRLKTLARGPEAKEKFLSRMERDRQGISESRERLSDMARRQSLRRIEMRAGRIGARWKP